MLVDAYDGKTVRAWLFSTNTRVDDAALNRRAFGAAKDAEEFVTTPWGLVMERVQAVDAEH